MSSVGGKKSVFICTDSLIKIKSNLSLYSLHYAKACNEFAGPISASLRPGYTATFEENFEEKLLRRRDVGNSVSDLTCPRFEGLQTSHSTDKRVTAQPTGRFTFSVAEAKY